MESTKDLAKQIQSGTQRIAESMGKKYYPDEFDDNKPAPPEEREKLTSGLIANLEQSGKQALEDREKEAKYWDQVDKGKQVQMAGMIKTFTID